MNGKPAGIPGNNVDPVLKVDISDTSEAYSLESISSGYYTFSIDLTKILNEDLVLSKEKTYWVVFAAKTNLTAYTATSRFNWSGGEIVGNKSQLVDPSNAFGAGATSWTDIYDLVGIEDLDGLAFSIEGESTLGTGEIYSNEKKVSIYPNPTTDVINVKSIASINTKSIQVFDLSGNIVSGNVNKNSINISSLPKGVYLVKVEDVSGKTFTQKVIKK